MQDHQDKETSTDDVQSTREYKKNPMSVHMRNVLAEVTLEQLFLRVLRVSPVNIIPSVLHIHL
jgi:hypothetical protein